MPSSFSRRNLAWIIVGVPLVLAAAVVLTITLLGQPVGVPTPQYLTPALYTRIQEGLTRAQIRALLPSPLPVVLTETIETKQAGREGVPEIVELVWREFGIGGTFNSFVEFRFLFKDGKLIRREHG